MVCVRKRAFVCVRERRGAPKKRGQINEIPANKGKKIAEAHSEPSMQHAYGPVYVVVEFRLARSERDMSENVFFFAQVQNGYRKV